MRAVRPGLRRLFLVAGLIAGAGRTYAAAAPAAIRFDATTCELGTVVQGEQPACTFDFVNLGSQELRIHDVEPSCGCTSALLTSPVLRPGARGSIRAVFDSSNFSGEIAKEIAVHSSDAAQPTTVLTVRALVEPEVEFEPRQAFFDDVHPGVPASQTVMLTNRRSEPIEIRAIETAPASFNCRLPSRTDPGRPLVVESWDRVRVEVEITPPAAISMPMAGECTLRIAGPRKNIFTLKLLALPAAR